MKDKLLQFEQVLAHAKALEAEGKYLQAVQLLENSLLSPEVPGKHYFRLAAVYTKMGHSQAAVETLKKLLMYDPNDTDTCLEIAEFFIVRQLWDEAVEFLALLDPEDIPASVFYMGFAYFNLRDFEHSLLCFRTAITLISRTSPLYSFTVEFLVRCQILTGNYEEALKLLDAAPADENPEQWLLLKAIVYSIKGMPVFAEEQILKAYKLAPENDEILEWCEKIYLQLEKPAKAIEFCRKAIQIFPHTRLTHYISLSKACLLSGNEAVAHNAARVGLRLDPKNEELLGILKRINRSA